MGIGSGMDDIYMRDTYRRNNGNYIRNIRIN